LSIFKNYRRNRRRKVTWRSRAWRNLRRGRRGGRVL